MKEGENKRQIFFPPSVLPGTCSIINHPDDSAGMVAATDSGKAVQNEEILYQTSSCDSDLVCVHLRDLLTGTNLCLGLKEGFYGLLLFNQKTVIERLQERTVRVHKYLDKTYWESKQRSSQGKEMGYSSVAKSIT